MSRIKDLINRIDEGVKNGFISEKEAKEFKTRPFSSRKEIDLLEEEILKITSIPADRL